MPTLKEKRERIAEVLRQGARSASACGTSSSGLSTGPAPVASREPIAIVGMSGYLPQSMTVEQFWESLDDDRSLIEEIPRSRFDWRQMFDPTGRDRSKSRSKWGGFIPDIRQFDAGLFGVLPSEARLMDPRLRLLAMSVYRSLEDAGHAPSSLRQKPVGVFVATEDDEYLPLVQARGFDPGGGFAHATGMTANTISYWFDFRGPSETVSAQCAGAAVALDRAVQLLRSGAITHAVVGAANLLLRADPFIQLSRLDQLSRTASVASFGKEAGGYVRAEGVASVVLRPLSQAVMDGDSVYAVIKNSAVNYNGHGLSIAAPNSASHAELIEECYRKAGIDPRRVRYIEAQGMGNPVTDVAEWLAFDRALNALAREQGVRLEAGNCTVSSLKPMIGHMHSASALGALFKIIRSLQTERLHKIVGFTELNPDLGHPGDICRPAIATESWQRGDGPRLAGLHSYGVGGSNAHLLIEEYCESPKGTAGAGVMLIPLSARSRPECIDAVRQLLAKVQGQFDHSLADVAHTLQQGRDEYDARVAFVADGRDTWIRQAGAYLQGQHLAGVYEGAADASQRGQPTEGLADPHDIARAWVLGQQAPWGDRFPNRSARRLHLPTYPFGTKPYWFDDGGDQAIAPQTPGASQAARAEDIVRAALSPYLGVAPADIDPDAHFSALGFDSILVIGLAERLKLDYAVHIERAQFYEYRSPRELIQGIARLLERQSGPVLVSRANPGTARATVAAAWLEPMAIVGLAGSFPHSPTVRELWANLSNGANCVAAVPAERWPHADYFEADPERAVQRGLSYGKWGGFLDDLYCFDPRFFSISPRDAAGMNPKERVFLQCAWHVLEDAGWPPGSLAGERVGVFVGATKAGQDLYDSSLNAIANRVSYCFDFRGPSMAIDTTCSSSLVAVYEACLHVRAGECSIAIAGGVHAILHPTHFAALAKGRFLSPDGKCKPFSADANGMAPGEGVGAVLIKPLSKAQRDHDHIYAIIRGAAANSGGKTNGYTVPNPLAQRGLIRSALERSGVHARQVSYVEAHGTGTALGDPIEVRALTEAFREDTADTEYCRLGSAKGNLGHLEAAAGIAGLAKILLQMKHRQLVPSLHAGESNPQIDFPSTPFRVQRELEDWKPTGRNGEPMARVACISSFGAGGTNAHAVLEEYQEVPLSHQGTARRAPHIVVLSAKSHERLAESARALLQHIRTDASRKPGAEGLRENEEGGLASVRRALAAILGVAERDLDDDEPFESCGVDRLQLSRLTAQFAQEPGAVNPDELLGSDSIRSAARRLFPKCLEATDASKAGGEGDQLADLAYTLQVGREAMAQRFGMLADSLDQLEKGLHAFLRSDDPERDEPRLFYRSLGESGRQGGATVNANRTDTSGIASWIDSGAYRELLAHWIEGGDVDWNALYGEGKPHGPAPRRVSLPGYPFAREEYGAPDLAEAKPRRASEAFLPETSQPICFEEVWEEQRLSSDSPAVAADLKTIVCLLTGPEHQRAFMERVRTLDPRAEVIFVGARSGEQMQLATRYNVDPGTAEDFEEVFRRIQDRLGAVDALLYLWPFDDLREIPRVDSQVALIKALAAVPLGVKRVVLAGGSTTGLERCHLESWIGFERTLRLVLPHIPVAAFIQDRNPGAPAETFSSVAQRLLVELRADRLESVLYHGDERRVLRCRRVDPPMGPGVLRSGGTYLITGGLGGLGIEFATHLAKTRSANLILTGRSPLDADMQCRIRALEELGAKVHYLRADVSDLGAMRAGLSEAKTRFSSIHGVIHAAGLRGTGDVRTKALGDFQAVLKPKIDGTLILDEVLAGESLDFICYFSSSSAFLGDFGSCDYAVANRFQMAFASLHNDRRANGERSGKAVAICWPLLASGGMGVGDADQTRLYLKSSGQRPLTSKEAFELFERLLSQTRPHQLVLAGQEDRLLRLLSMQGNDAASGKRTAPQRRQRGTASGGLSIEDRVSLYLRETIVELLGPALDSVAPDTNLADFGFDSITLHQFAASLAGHYGMELTPAVFFVHTNVAQLTKYLLTEHGESIRAFYGEAGSGHHEEPARIAMKAHSDGGDRVDREPIAIIGMSGLFPQCRNTEEMWRVLVEGRDTVDEIPPSRFDWRLHYGDPAEDGTKTNGKWCGTVPGVDEFDALFFGISPREADEMDPRQRLLLQESWRALEDAGYGSRQIEQHRIGMFVGAEEGEYGRLGGAGQITSNHNALVASRLAYFLGFRGPVMAINTACSSSLVAAHQACSSLRLGECDTAIAAGVNLMLTPGPYVAMAKAGMLSSDGKCFAFDERAHGLVPGEAIAVVVLKRLSLAVAEGDPIHAVIRGSGINYDGRTNGITAPSGKAQASLLQEVYRNSGVNPNEIEHVVTHGTGTVLGDAVELNALRAAFDASRLDGPCALTSCKTNFGHTFAASGLVSLISLALGLRHETIPASLHCDGESGDFRKQPTRFYVNRSARAWRRRAGRPRAGAVSAFGMSGTNAHMVLQEWAGEREEPVTPAAPFFLLAVSGKTQQALQERIAGMIRALGTDDVRAYGLARVSYTLLDGRRHFPHRCAIVVRDPEEAIEVWQGFGKQRRPNLFTGQVARGFTGSEAVRNSAIELVAASRALCGEPEEYRKSLCALAETYCQGYELPWADLYDAGPPRRVSLPTYPFSRERHWVTQGETDAKPTPRDEQGASSMKTHLLYPAWNPVALSPDAPLLPGETSQPIVLGCTTAQLNEVLSLYPRARVLKPGDGDSPATLAAALQGPAPVEHILWIAPETRLHAAIDETCLEEQERGVIAVFRLLKAVLALGYRDRDLGWTFLTTQARAVYPHEIVDPVHAGVHGLVGALAKEFPRWKVRLVDIEPGSDLPFRELFSLPFDPQGHALAHRGSQWLAETLIPVHDIETGPTLYRRGGVYVVIGGAGGIGEVWTRWVIERHQAHVIWIGRRQQDNRIEAKLDALSAAGPRPVYIQADASNREALERAYQTIKRQHPQIHGVIHSAVGLFDRNLEETDEERFRTILSAKVGVSVRLAQVFGVEPLDFLLFFSSMVAFGKNGGLSGYAAGCCFADAFAHRLGAQTSGKVKVMNWGYWSTGAGLAVPPAAKARLKTGGIGAIEAGEGMQTLDALLGGPFNQLACVKALELSAISGVDTEEWATNYPATIPPLLQNLDAVSLPQDRGLSELEAAHFIEDPLLKDLLLKFLRRTLEGVEKHGDRPAFYDRWLDESRRILAKNPLLQSGCPSREELWGKWEQAKHGWLQNSHAKASVVLMEACLRNLPDVLAGTRRAVDVLFPDSTVSLVEGVYQGHPVADFFNDALAKTLCAYLKAGQSGERSAASEARRLRILEIGAGTGGTTAKVLPVLGPFAAELAEYCYTDVSKAFLFHAEEAFARDAPYLSTRIFDVMEPLAAQKIDCNGFDIVIATNVLHATRDIRQALRNAKAALKNNGLLLINEITRGSLFGHLTFGLLEGWWMPLDRELRLQGSPGLSPERWRAVLREEGFRSILFPVEFAVALGQQVIAAESDGIVRQRRALSWRAPKQGRTSAPDAEAEASRRATDESLREKTRKYLTNLLAKTLRMPVDQLDTAEPLENYGIDSILAVQAVNELRKAFGGLSSTLFFEIGTIDELVSYFVSLHREALVSLLGLDDVAISDRTPNRAAITATAAMCSGPAHTEKEAIAIIGMSGRYPEAETLEQFWENLKAGRDCVGEVPAGRWPLDGFYEEDKEQAVTQGKSYSKWGAFLEGFAEFDPLFFNISPREAMAMDPQERLFLQSAWWALEDAGYTRQALKAIYRQRVGVFAGITRTGFELYGPELRRRGGDLQLHTSFSSVANRVSYVLDLTGPSMPIDTMCSSSLTAIHEACEHLHRGECEMAFAGGVNLYLHPSSYMDLCSQRMLSLDGRCRSFGRGADGFVPGEGVGVVLLKPLSRAVQDGDRIYAAIRGTSANHGGRTSGYTVPNPVAQSELIRDALTKAGVNARTVSYVEAHGTGTELGDPIEINGLTRAYREDTRDIAFCALGSVKSNLGHLEAASGIAGLTKTVLQMKHGQLVASLHASALNPLIDFEGSPFVVQQQLTAWERPVVAIDGQTREFPRVAGVSSFGAGGANAHVILEEYVPVATQAGSVAPTWTTPAIVPLSARTEERLQCYATELLAFLRRGDRALQLADVAYTLQVGREALDIRLGLIVTSLRELEVKLDEFLQGRRDDADVFVGQVERGRGSMAVFSADEDLAGAIDAWIAHGKYSKLVEFWVRGLTFDWSKIYPQGREGTGLPMRPRRIDLPKYPFARDRYWILDQAPASREDETPVRIGRPGQESTFLVPGWDLVALSEPGVAQTRGRMVVASSREARAEYVNQVDGNPGIEIDVDDTAETLAGKVAGFDSLDHVVWIAPASPLSSATDEALIQEQDVGVLQLFRLVKALLARGYGLETLRLTAITSGSQCVLAGEAVNPTHAGVHGLMGSLAKEYPHWSVESIDVEPGCRWPAAEMLRLPVGAGGAEYGYRRGEWRRRVLLSAREIPRGGGLYRPQGVYVVIGGSGGLGEAWSRVMIREHRAQIVWLGRRELDAQIQAQLRALSSPGPAPIYIRADATDRVALQSAYEEIKQRHGHIHGVIHAAIVLSDQTVEKMDEARFRSVLESKVDVCTRLAQVFAREPLDFALFFSSTAAFGKPAGQSNYAAGCTFKDAFARRLSQEWTCPVKVMNWGYWGSVGVAARSSYGELMERAGVGSIEPEEGWKALEVLMRAPLEQLGFIKLLRSDSIAELRTDASLTYYPETIPSVIGSLEEPRQEPIAHLERARRAELRHVIPDGVLLKLLMGGLQGAGVFPGGRASTADIQAALKRSGLQERWFAESLGVLAAGGFLKRTGSGWTVVSGEVDLPTLWRDWDRTGAELKTDAREGAPFRLVETCLRSLPRVLTGELSPASVLFPDSSLAMVEGVYRGNAIADYFNQVLRETLETYLESRLCREPDADVRILEIGAGTGGTTASVLEVLKRFAERVVEYCYTDVSNAFLLHGRTQYGPQIPQFVTKIFDVTMPIAAQGIAAGHYDIVIAANVLHATPNIRESVRNAKAALRKNGILLLNEIDRNSLFHHLTFGMLKEWWSYEDAALRMPGCPALSADNWSRVLGDEGFGTVLLPGAAGSDLGQQVIVAESDGIVRQRAKRTPTEPKSKKSTQFPPPSSQAPPSRPPPAMGDGTGSLVTAAVVESLSQCLQVPNASIDHRIPFADYGLDSILGIRVVRSINDRLGIKLNSTVLFEHATVERLTGYIASVHKDAIARPVAEGVRSGPRAESRAISGRPPDVAVIGMSGQFPGASDVAGFWQNLLDGRDSISDLPAHYLEPMPGDSTPGQAPECLRGGYLENRARFDPLFFNLSPREAEAMNPHQRLILQEGWRSLEDAGYNPKSLADSKVAVYIGAELSRYGNASFTGSSEALVASRLSYYLDLKGPAMVINTGCSSSGTAIHLACESLRHGEACMALAGGVFAALDREMIATVGRAGMVSRKGRCNTFDAGADGTVFAEAVGVVVLKRLEDALRDSDHIYGVIQGSGVNQDGTSNGITAPNGAAQEALLADVYRRFNVEPAEIGYVEVHGTGTALGDPVEGNALVRAFGAFTDRQHYCAVGSAKSHIGHTAAASAVVGLIKLLLSLKHGLIPRMPHFERLNPLIEFDRSPFYVNPERVAWESPGGGLRMGALSSFGHGGTNVHLVVREHPVPARGRRDIERQPRELVVLSARNSERLMESAQKLREFLLKTPPDLGDLAYTLQVGREAMEERVAFETNGIAECVARLEEIGEGRIPERKSWRGSVGDGRKSAAAREQCSGTAGLDEIAECWVNGGEVDWRLLRRDEVPRRVSLPSYPFALEYHWLTRTDVAARAPAATQAREEEAFELLCFEETWCTSELVPPTRKGECARKTVLCFLSGAQAQRAVRDEMSLLHPETRVVFAAVSDGYRRDSADTYRVAVDDPESYGQLFRTVRAESESGAIDDILYLWALEDQAYIRDTAPIVTILQQAADAQLRPKRVLLAGTYGPDLDRCYLESWIGFERSLRLVWPQTEVRVVVQENGAAAGSDLVKRVVAELEAGEARSVLYKNTERREPGMVSRTLSGAESAIPQEGSILIAGGLGGLGAIFAEHLARTRGLNLILTGRSGLDRVKQARIEKLRTLGSAAIYVQADICDETAMRRGIETAKHRFGEISGVIHAAGVSSGLSIFQKDHKAFQSVLGPKVTGTVVLDRLLAEDPLRFVCYFSSTAAVLGDFGACDYAVGNRFQMAYASHREELRAQGTRSGKTVVINWPLWRDGGMGVGDEEQQAFYLKSSGQRALEAEEGLSTFERIMRADGVQHIVLVGKPSRVVRFLKQGHATAVAPSGAAHHDAEEFAGWGGARERLVAELRSLVSQHLKVPENLLNEDKNLAEVGLDSILLAELAQRLSQRYATEITPAILFGHPSLGKLARHFWEDHQDLVRRHYSAPPEASLPVAAPVSSRPRRGCRGVKEEPIAIIGMSGRFAQADSVAELWARVKRSASCISEVPDERWFWRSAERVRGGFIRGVDRFDPLFFAIAPRDANAMDPGQRLFLEEAWHTFEDAGYMGARIRGTSCGVFVGVEESEYRVLTGARSIDGNQNATLAARIAYALDLKGPNFALTASCSSGLVAVHQACLALRQQDCELALAGGVSLMLSPANHQALLAAGMLSPDGVCRVFDGRANGLVPGEAVAAVLLKPLNKALRDGDRVYACITGSGINYDGASNGITAPNYVSQSELLANTYDRHGIDPADIQFVMAHSVGSSLTDPVEVEALTTAFRKYSSETGYCHLGSIKPLIGHTFAASGVVGLIGVVMAMRDRIIPGTQGYERANSALRLEGSPFVLSAQNTDWTSQDGRPRVGAVSTAGISGTNAHIVIEEHVETEDRTTERPAPAPQLAVLSARNRERLMAVADQMVRFLETNPDISLPDLCYTLQVGRDPMQERWAAVVGSVEQLIQGMRGFVAPAATSEGQPAHDGPTSAALEGLRDAWLDGAVVPFERLHAGRSPRIVSLPTYPFVRRSCWIRQGAEPHHGDLAPSGNKVVDLYSYLAKDKTAEYQMEYLTFFPFTKRIPGFSMTRVALNPERYPDEVALIKARQIELRQVLFCREDFSAMQSVLDFGCGHGTDVIQMASQYPHIHVHGITITPAQAELGRSRIERLGLSPRAAIFNQDSAKNSFPGRYDMVFGIEVACHIQDKQSLFQNIVSSLKEGGRVLLMEFIANLRGPIADPNVSVYIPTRENWAELLAEHGLVIDENVDVTAEIANGQYDPEFEQNTKDLPEVVRASWRNYANNSIAMSKGWVGYSLFRLYVDRRLCFAGRKAHNARKLADETPYRDALEQTLRRGSPYPGAEDQRAVMGSSLGEGR